MMQETYVHENKVDMVENDTESQKRTTSICVLSIEQDKRFDLFARKLSSGFVS